MADIRMRNFQAIPPVIKNLLIINGLAYLAQQIFVGPDFHFTHFFALHDIRAELFRPHQIVTHMFLHGDFWHLLFNMFALWMFGSMLENIWGPKRFLIFYMLSGLGAAILHLAVLYYELTPTYQLLPTLSGKELLDNLYKVNQATLGASGAVFGCLAAFGYLFPNSLIYIYAIIPVKAKYFVIFYAAMELWLGIRNSAGDNVAHWAHLGGALVGFLLVWYWNKNNRHRFY
jgi:membrane associated rhomboid family serine protease